mgnify:CR=1 FL=1
MAKKEIISVEDCKMWRSHPCTKKLFEALQEIRDNTESSMTNESVIVSDKCQLTLVRALGILEGLDVVLQMEIEGLIDEEEPTR